MKSPGSSGAPPTMPTPQGAPTTNYGQATPFTPQYQNFLPNTPGSMATGLTPEMMAGMNKTPLLPINNAQTRTQPPPRPNTDMKNILAMLMQKNRERTMHNGGFGYQQSGHGGDR